MYFAVRLKVVYVNYLHIPLFHRILSVFSAFHFPDYTLQVL